MSSTTPLRIAVVQGGRSSEAEVSRTSGRQVLQALRGRGHRAELVEADDELWDALRTGFDAVFIALHGRYGEDGTVQGVCELLDLPYTGSGLLATALCLDKAMAKRVLVAEGINTPPWRLLSRHLQGAADVAECMGQAAGELGLPMVVKPNRGGSTIGLSVVRQPGDLAEAFRNAAAHDDVLCERFVPGLEITVGVLGHNPPQALPTLEIVSHRPLYDYAAKYTAGQSEHIIPARLPEEQRQAAQRAAERAHAALGCRGMSRVDVLVDTAGVPWVIEVNAIPGLTELSLLPDAARAAGVGFDELCQRLVDDALQRHAEEHAR
jgi:D-alanine-D-alanine ligase